MGYYDGSEQKPRQLREGRYFTGSVALPRVTPPPGSLKTCSGCGETKPIEQFSRSKRNPDGHEYACKTCRGARLKLMRAGQRKAAVAHRWKRMVQSPTVSGATLLAAVDELLSAAREARSSGMWRGRDAIRAYKRLGDALDIFHRDGSYKRVAIDPKSPPCICPDWPCPRHAPEVEETDEDFMPDAADDEHRSAIGG